MYVLVWLTCVPISQYTRDPLVTAQCQSGLLIMSSCVVSCGSLGCHITWTYTCQVCGSEQGTDLDPQWNILNRSVCKWGGGGGRELIFLLDRSFLLWQLLWFISSYLIHFHSLFSIMIHALLSHQWHSSNCVSVKTAVHLTCSVTWFRQHHFASCA